MKKLIAYGFNVNQTCSKEQYTPLYVASYTGNLELVKYLIEVEHANPYLYSDNKSVLDIAIIYGFDPIIKYLISTLMSHFSHIVS